MISFGQLKIEHPGLFDMPPITLGFLSLPHMDMTWMPRPLQKLAIKSRKIQKRLLPRYMSFCTLMMKLSWLKLVCHAHPAKEPIYHCQEMLMPFVVLLRTQDLDSRQTHALTPASRVRYCNLWLISLPLEFLIVSSSACRNPWNTWAGRSINAYKDFWWWFEVKFLSTKIWEVRCADNPNQPNQQPSDVSSNQLKRRHPWRLPKCKRKLNSLFPVQSRQPASPVVSNSGEHTEPKQVTFDAVGWVYVFCPHPPHKGRLTGCAFRPGNCGNCCLGSQVQSRANSCSSSMGPNHTNQPNCHCHARESALSE